jgi:DNA-binding MarR family transcriptional regulator
MQAAKTIVRDASASQRLVQVSEKELILLSEIGLDDIPTATSFVEYIADKYAISASGVWYTLKKLKEKRVVDFTERVRGEEYKPLSLTAYGRGIIRRKISEFNFGTRNLQMNELVRVRAGP